MATCKLVIVTGGARGIGARLVHGFLSTSYCVSTCDLLEFDRNSIQSALANKASVSAEHASKDLSESLHTFQCDVTKTEQVQNFIKSTAEFFAGRAEWTCLINNAAIANPYMPTAEG